MFSPLHQSLVVKVTWGWARKTRLFVILTAVECKYSLSFVLPADKLQLHSPSKNISNPEQSVQLVWSFILDTLTHTDYRPIRHNFKTSGWVLMLWLIGVCSQQVFLFFCMKGYGNVLLMEESQIEQYTSLSTKGGLFSMTHNKYVNRNSEHWWEIQIKM